MPFNVQCQGRYQGDPVHISSGGFLKHACISKWRLGGIDLWEELCAINLKLSPSFPE